MSTSMPFYDVFNLASLLQLADDAQKIKSERLMGCSGSEMSNELIVSSADCNNETERVTETNGNSHPWNF